MNLKSGCGRGTIKHSGFHFTDLSVDSVMACTPALTLASDRNSKKQIQRQKKQINNLLHIPTKVLREQI